ncbi:WD domain, G-beta repeat [Novymonas esmeraldas]|uniref:WD domain, G-beta repeat n=1 Tax=Novymonas esmeraldas TaxID=1808958 RepID=A0AAW0EYZ4_9TRYP
MWTRRRVFPAAAVPATPHEAALTTPRYEEQRHDVAGAANAFTLDEDAFTMVASLAYTLVPTLSAEEAGALLSWALPPAWAGDRAVSAEVRAARLAAAAQRAVALGACTQVEYFFVGTENGQVFLMPLLPPHLLEALVEEGGDVALPGLAQAWQREAALVGSAGEHPGHVPLNCVGRRLLHRHMREEPVAALDHLGTLLASAASSGDTSVALSLFHPVPRGITCLPHPCVVRSVKLWEGAAFTAQPSTAATDASTAAEQRWRDAVRAAEPTAVYVFTGDDAGIVRLWRVDVVAGSYALQHVLVCSARTTGMRSPLTPFARDDSAAAAPSCDADRVMHCLDVDEAAGRLYAGTEGGVCVWAIDALPWRGPTAVTAAALATQHPLCWDERRRAPLQCALPDAGGLARDADAASVATVEYRVARLANHHVWVLPAATVQPAMSRAAERASGAGSVGGWKPKYGRVVTGGAAVGVVSNTVRLSAAAAPVDGGGGDGDDGAVAVADRLTDTAVPVSFEGGEVKNDLRVPLSCVVPVVYPLAFLRTPGTACFAVRVLASGRRLVTSCADGKVCVWACGGGDAEVHVPQLVTSTPQTFRGLGRHICVVRAPDVFVTCSYDDGLVKEWHIYDEPQMLLRCARRFTLTPHSPESGGSSAQQRQQLTDAVRSMLAPGDAKDAKDGDGAAAEESGENEEGDAVGGISCAVAYPAFGAVFLVGAFESAIQTYSLTEVAGCEPPRNYVYNGHKTVRLPASMAEDVYDEL